MLKREEATALVERVASALAQTDTCNELTDATVRILQAALGASYGLGIQTGIASVMGDPPVSEGAPSPEGRAGGGESEPADPPWNDDDAPCRHCGAPVHYDPAELVAGWMVLRDKNGRPHAHQLSQVAAYGQQVRTGDASCPTCGCELVVFRPAGRSAYPRECSSGRPHGAGNRACRRFARWAQDLFGGRVRQRVRAAQGE